MALAQELEGFTGTEDYHRFSILAPSMLLTDGAQYLAEKAKCYWLMDIIASVQRKPAVRKEEMQVWELTVKNQKGRVVCTDGNDHKLYVQLIEYTDFPLPYIKLYANVQDEYRIILLPSEN